MSENDLARVWARSLDELSDLQIEPYQRAWLKLTRPLGLVENTALIATPNEFVKEQLETRLRALVTHALSRELGRNIQLAVTVDPAPAGQQDIPPVPPPRPGSPFGAAGPGLPDGADPHLGLSPEAGHRDADAGRPPAGAPGQPDLPGRGPGFTLDPRLGMQPGLGSPDGQGGPQLPAAGPETAGRDGSGPS